MWTHIGIFESSQFEGLYVRDSLYCIHSVDKIILSSVQFSRSIVSTVCDSWTAACQSSLSVTNYQSLLKLMSIELVMPPNYLILCHPFLLLPLIFPSIRVFSSESVLCIRRPKCWSFSFSIGPSNEYSGMISFRPGWLISLQPKGLSRVFSNTTGQKHQFFSTQFSLWSKSHIHTWLLESHSRSIKLPPKVS